MDLEVSRCHRPRGKTAVSTVRGVGQTRDGQTDGWTERCLSVGPGAGEGLALREKPHPWNCFLDTACISPIKTTAACAKVAGAEGAGERELLRIPS